MTIEDLKKFYVTYGGNTHQARNYSVIEAPNMELARNAVFAVTGGHHAFIYNEESWNHSSKDVDLTQAEAYNLKEIPLQAAVRKDVCDEY